LTFRGSERAVADGAARLQPVFRWFVGLSMDDAVEEATVFSKNRDRLLAGDIARRFLEQIVAQARDRGLASDEHFSVDGTLIEAWRSRRASSRRTTRERALVAGVATRRWTSGVRSAPEIRP